MNNNYVYTIRVTEGWYDDWDDKYMLEDAFMDINDAMIFIEQYDIKKHKSQTRYYREWQGDMMKVYEKRTPAYQRKEYGDIERATYEIVRLNLHY